MFSSLLASMCYKKRNKMDPYYIEGCIAGIKNGKTTLTLVDLYGNRFDSDYIATGFARMLVPSVIEREHRLDMSYEEARALLVKCFKALSARHKTADNILVFCDVTSEGIREERDEFNVEYSYKGYLEKEDFIY